MDDHTTVTNRILIVDDNPKNLQVLGKFLQNEQYELEFAINGSAALEWLEIKPFDLILLDINMPGMDGFEVCKKIRSDHKMDKMPVIFLTAETFRESVLKGFEIGAQDYITKPFDSRELIMRVKTHLSIKNQMEQLENLNQSLEVKVLERTAELNKAKEKAEESDRLKSAFLINISHEIRTPLNGIFGFLQLLDKVDLDEARKKDFSTMVHSSGQRLLNTINDIIELSTIEAEKSILSFSEVNIMEVMQFHYEFFMPQAEEKLLELIIAEQITGTSAIVQTDKLKLDRIITNLLKNAILFTSQGTIEFGNYLDNDTIVFYVKDSGIGIPSNRIEAVFDRFVQADLSLSRGHEGAGIGLSIAKAYVEALKGNIWVQSVVDQGSTFFFSIPHRLLQ
ncbi:MAG: hybrid sensor histidine kinase/response regulator [Bacteroidales bacterium]